MINQSWNVSSPCGQSQHLLLKKCLRSIETEITPTLSTGGEGRGCVHEVNKWPVFPLWVCACACWQSVCLFPISKQELQQSKVWGVEGVSGRLTDASLCKDHAGAAVFAVSAAEGVIKDQGAQVRPSGLTRTPALQTHRDAVNVGIQCMRGYVVNVCVCALPSRSFSIRSILALIWWWRDSTCSSRLSWHSNIDVCVGVCSSQLACAHMLDLFVLLSPRVSLPVLFAGTAVPVGGLTASSCFISCILTKGFNRSIPTSTEHNTNPSTTSQIHC